MSYNLAECVKPISYIKSNAAAMIDFVNESHQPLIVTQNGEAKAVLTDIKSYQEMKDAFSLLKMIELSTRDFQNGDYKDSDEVFSTLRKKYGLEN